MNTSTTITDTEFEDTRLLAHLQTIEGRAKLSEVNSQRNGWTDDISVYPGTFVDDLLDLRACFAAGSDDSTTPTNVARALIDETLRLHGRRPGVTTTSEVQTFCRQLRDTLHGGTR
jgi:hypothetical protein